MLRNSSLLVKNYSYESYNSLLFTTVLVRGGYTANYFDSLTDRSLDASDLTTNLYSPLPLALKEYIF